MNRKAGVLTLPSGRKLRIAELLVAQDESVSSEFNGAEVQSGKRHGEYNRALMAASIIEVDGKRIDASTFDPRKVLISVADWNLLTNAYNTMTDAGEIGKRVAQAISSTAGAAGELLKATVTLSDGRQVVMQQLTPDVDEAIDLKGRYTARDFVRALYDKIEASIISVGGAAVDRAVFKARVEIPLSRDWSVLASVYRHLNAVDSVPDFLPESLD